MEKAAHGFLHLDAYHRVDLLCENTVSCTLMIYAFFFNKTVDIKY